MIERNPEVIIEPVGWNFSKTKVVHKIGRKVLIIFQVHPNPQSLPENTVHIDHNNIPVPQYKIYEQTINKTP